MAGRPLPWNTHGTKERPGGPPWVPPPAATSPNRSRGSPPPRLRRSRSHTTDAASVQSGYGRRGYPPAPPKRIQSATGSSARSAAGDEWADVAGMPLEVLRELVQNGRAPMAKKHDQHRDESASSLYHPSPPHSPSQTHSDWRAMFSGHNSQLPFPSISSRSISPTRNHTRPNLQATTPLDPPKTRPHVDRPLKTNSKSTSGTNPAKPATSTSKSTRSHSPWASLQKQQHQPRQQQRHSAKKHAAGHPVDRNLTFNSDYDTGNTTDEPSFPSKQNAKPVHTQQSRSDASLGRRKQGSVHSLPTTRKSTQRAVGDDQHADSDNGEGGLQKEIESLEARLRDKKRWQRELKGAQAVSGYPRLGDASRSFLSSTDEEVTILDEQSILLRQKADAVERLRHKISARGPLSDPAATSSSSSAIRSREGSEALVERTLRRSDGDSPHLNPNPNPAGQEDVEIEALASTLNSAWRLLVTSTVTCLHRRGRLADVVEECSAAFPQKTGDVVCDSLLNILGYTGDQMKHTPAECMYRRNVVRDFC